MQFLTKRYSQRSLILSMICYHTLFNDFLGGNLSVARTIAMFVSLWEIKKCKSWVYCQELEINTMFH